MDPGEYYQYKLKKNGYESAIKLCKCRNNLIHIMGARIYDKQEN